MPSVASVAEAVTVIVSPCIGGVPVMSALTCALVIVVDHTPVLFVVGFFVTSVPEPSMVTVTSVLFERPVLVPEMVRVFSSSVSSTKPPGDGVNAEGFGA